MENKLKQDNKLIEKKEKLFGLVTDDFIHWGADRFAYIREVNDSTGMTFALSSADGTELGVFEQRDVAIAFATQYDLVPQAVN